MDFFAIKNGYLSNEMTFFSIIFEVTDLVILVFMAAAVTRYRHEDYLIGCENISEHG